MIETDETYRTDDLTLATVLAVAGFTYVLQKLNTRKVVWVFEPPADRAEEFDEALGAFEEFGCKVEPRSFVGEMAKLRREMYEALGIQPNSRRSRVPSS